VNVVELFEQLDQASLRAAALIDIEDADGEESYWSLVDERRHCGVCIVSVVMEQLVPVLERYFDS
jgi:hypothetical protein